MTDNICVYYRFFSKKTHLVKCGQVDYKTYFTHRIDLFSFEKKINTSDLIL